MSDYQKNSNTQKLSATMIGAALGATAALIVLGIVGPRLSDSFEYLLGPGVFMVFALGLVDGWAIWGINRIRNGNLADWQVVAISNLIIAIAALATQSHADTISLRIVVMILVCGTGAGLGAVLANRPAALVGGAAMLVIPTDKEAKAIATARDKIAHIEKLTDSVSSKRYAEAKRLLNEIVYLLKKVRSAIEQDRNKWSVSGKFLDLYVVNIESWVQKYTTLLQRELDIAQETLKQAEEQTLPLFRDRVQQLYESLHIADTASLPTELELSFPKIELELEENQR